MIPMLSLRAGFDQSVNSIDEDVTAVTTAYTLGMGMEYQGFRFDYAYKLNPEFSELSTHYFSMCYNGFEEPKAEKAEKNTIAEQPETKPEGTTTVVAEQKSSGDDILDQYRQLIESNDKKVSQAQ